MYWKYLFYKYASCSNEKKDLMTSIFSKKMQILHENRKGFAVESTGWKRFLFQKVLDDNNKDVSFQVE